MEPSTDLASNANIRGFTPVAAADQEHTLKHRFFPHSGIFLLILMLVLASAVSHPARSQDLQLPQLGDASSALVSLPEEHKLGRSWLRDLRAKADILEDPLMTELLESLVYRLLPHANTPQSQLAFVTVNQQELNAFAVPGGIIGVNFGLLLHTRDEDEMSSVIAHELAHLSQRHFARRNEVSQNEAPIALAALLASILLAATVDADVGMAGIMATQGASIQNQLSYSRAWEREADRIGFSTMVEAGLDPHAMPDMFRNMQDAAKFYRKPPEFLLTHPLTSRRIADAADRAERYATRPRRRSFLFGILRNEAMRQYQLAEDQQNVFFTRLLSRNPTLYDQAILNYTLAQIELDHERPEKAQQYAGRIPDAWKNESAAIIQQSHIMTALGKSAQALKLLEQQRHWFPESYAFNLAYTDQLSAMGQKKKAMDVLREINERRPDDPLVWAKLAELALQTENRLLAHQASAEALFLRGDDSRAARHMDLAILEATKAGNFKRREALRERLKKMAAAGMKQEQPGQKRLAPEN